MRAKWGTEPQHTGAAKGTLGQASYGAIASRVTAQEERVRTHIETAFVRNLGEIDEGDGRGHPEQNEGIVDK